MVHKDDPKRNFPQKWHNQIKRTDEEYVFIGQSRVVSGPNSCSGIFKTSRLYVDPFFKIFIGQFMFPAG